MITLRYSQIVGPGLVSLDLPAPPPGFRWELGGWMGGTPERPWPDLKPDPDVTITLPVSDWRGIREYLYVLGRGQRVDPGSVMGVKAGQHADQIGTRLALHVAEQRDAKL